MEMSIEVNKYDMANNPSVVEMMRTRCRMPATATIEKVAERFALVKHFEVSEHPSQFIHGTFFAMGTMLEPGVSRRFPGFSMEFDEENELLCGFLDLFLGDGRLIGRVSGIDVSATLDPLRENFDAIRARYVAE